MKRLALLAVAALIAFPAAVDAQAAALADSTARLTYRFARPTQAALEITKTGLLSFDAVLVSIDLQRGDSIAQITGRVRDETWVLNPEVAGSAPGQAPEIYFGRLQTYLRGDPRFRILVRPSPCAGCEGMREAVFLRYNETGYLLGRPRRGRPSPSPDRVP